MNALCDVVNSLTDATRAFGPNSDYEALAKQSQVLSSVRRNLGNCWSSGLLQRNRN